MSWPQSSQDSLPGPRFGIKERLRPLGRRGSQGKLRAPQKVLPGQGAWAEGRQEWVWAQGRARAEGAGSCSQGLTNGGLGCQKDCSSVKMYSSSESWSNYEELF